MRTSRNPDHLDATANVAERVRKLEVMQQGLAYRPNEWRNRETLLDVATQLVYAQSHWERPVFGEGDQWPEDALDRVGQQTFDILMTTGYETPYYAQAWTDLLIYCAAINPCPGGNFATTAAPAGAPPPVNDGPSIVFIDDASLGADDATWQSSDDRRVCVWTSLPEGDWHYAAPGAEIAAGPGHSFPAMPAGSPLILDSVTVHRPGNFYLQHGVPGAEQNIFWTGTNTTVYATGPTTFESCFGLTPPFEPQMNAYTPGGQPINGSYINGCPANPASSVPDAGSMSGAYIINPDELYLACPPFQWTGQAGTMLTHPDSGDRAPDYDDLRARVTLGLGYFPGVADWINRWQPTTAPNQKWHRLARHIRAQGGAEMQVRDRQVVIRGTLRILTELTPGEPLVWFDDRQIPPPAIDGGAGQYLRAHTNTGQIVPLQIGHWPNFSLFPHIWYMSIHRPENFIDSPYDLTLILDGLSYPTDITLY